MSGGRTKDGGDIVGASVFYHDPPPDDEICGNKSSGAKKSDDPVKLNASWSVKIVSSK